MFFKGTVLFLGAALLSSSPLAQTVKKPAPQTDKKPASQAEMKSAPQGGKTLVLETQTIEGKIKRPQAALLTLEKRPVFKPMALTQIDVKKNVLKDVDVNVFENRIYTQPFAPEKRP